MLTAALWSRPKTKRARVLEFVAASPDGRRFGESQRFIVEMNGKNYDEVVERNCWIHKDGLDSLKPRKQRRWAGYWCDTLGGSTCGQEQPWWRRGLLDRFCTKVDRRYYPMFLRNGECFVSPDGRFKIKVYARKLHAKWSS
jgi:hypothetical protein